MNIGSLLGCALSNQLIQSFSSVSSFPSPSFPSTNPLSSPTKLGVGYQDVDEDTRSPTKLGVGYQDVDEDTRSDQEGENDHERRKNTEEGKVFTDSIEDLCQCQCNICHKRMTSKSLKEHIRKQHKLDRREYISIYGEIQYSKLTYHRCKMCEKTLKAAVIVISNHLKKVHNLNFQQYRNMFGVFEGDNSRTKIFIKNEKMKLESLEDTRDSIVEDTGKPIQLNPTPGNPVETTTDSEKSSDFLRSFYFNHFLNNFQNLNETLKRLGRRSESSDIPTSASSSPDTGVRLTSGHQSEDEDEVEDGADLVFTDCMADLCESECRLCGKRMTIKSLREHVRLRHSGNIQEYRKKFGEITYTKLTYHRCKVCRGVMKAAVITISHHLKRHHDLSFQEYKELFQVFLSRSKRSKRSRSSNSPTKAASIVNLSKTTFGIMPAEGEKGLVSDVSGSPWGN